MQIQYKMQGNNRLRQLYNNEKYRKAEEKENYNNKKNANKQQYSKKATKRGKKRELSSKQGISIVVCYKHWNIFAKQINLKTI